MAREEDGVGDGEPTAQRNRRNGKAAAVVQNAGTLTSVGFKERGATYILSHENQSDGAPKENEILAARAKTKNLRCRTY
jgi:hypothetical protein